MLKSALNYNKALSTKIVVAICCLHNFIAQDSKMVENTMVLMNQDERKIQIRAECEPRAVLALAIKKLQGEMQRDKIAEAMWNNYQEIIRTRRFR